MLLPGLVWFGEQMPRLVWDAAELAVRGCQVLLIAGTSARVYPAAGLIAAGGGVSLRGLSGELLPQLLNATR